MRRDGNALEAAYSSMHGATKACARKSCEEKPDAMITQTARQEGLSQCYKWTEEIGQERSRYRCQLEIGHNGACKFGIPAAAEPVKERDVRELLNELGLTVARIEAEQGRQSSRYDNKIDNLAKDLTRIERQLSAPVTMVLGAEISKQQEDRWAEFVKVNAEQMKLLARIEAHLEPAGGSLHQELDYHAGMLAKISDRIAMDGPLGERLAALDTRLGEIERILKLLPTAELVKAIAIEAARPEVVEKKLKPLESMRGRKR